MRERKYKKVRTPREMFIVFCEGETERNYIELLKRHYRLPITIKTKISGAHINDRFVNQCVREVISSDIKSYEVYFIYDADVPAVVEKITNLKEGKAILSNPCIELWFILHAKPHLKSTVSEEMVRKLRESADCWKNYKKGILSKEQEKMLIENRDTASSRASSLSFPYNPSSNFHQFLDALEKARHR